MKALVRWALLMGLALLFLQLYFVARIAAMAVVDPQSTPFQRSEVWRIVTEKGELRWRQQWVSYDRISPHLKRAVIASEDDGLPTTTVLTGTRWRKPGRKMPRLRSVPSAKTPRV